MWFRIDGAVSASCTASVTAYRTRFFALEVSMFGKNGDMSSSCSFGCSIDSVEVEKLVEERHCSSRIGLEVA